jgi:hypothetical protein
LSRPNLIEDEIAVNLPRNFVGRTDFVGKGKAGWRALSRVGHNRLVHLRHPILLSHRK